ncbi:hypothetical protein SJAV_18860 [Sulfurisphaera javensis]|uniref:Uncharacterized protein n=1 Tax=Sulfurisphaera javensis TaxID=2049879 RepID=A0AAT9GTJ5_9CREN
MSSFLFRLLGVDEIIKDIEEKTKELIYPLKLQRENSLELLKELLKNYNVNIELKESNKPVDEARRLTALASNLTPLSIENPEEVLWQLAQAIKPKGLKKCQK